LTDDLDGDEAGHTGIVTGRTEDIGLRMFDDLFANGVFVNMDDPV